MYVATATIAAIIAERAIVRMDDLFFVIIDIVEFLTKKNI